MKIKLIIQAELCKDNGDEPDDPQPTWTEAIVEGDKLCPDCVAQQALDLLGAIEGLTVVTEFNERRYHFEEVRARPGGRVLYRGYRQ